MRAALANVVGEEAEQKISASDGHHGNPIIVLESSVEDPRAIDSFFQKLEPATSESLLSSLECRIDEACNLFVKLDKQAAFASVLKAATNDDVVSVRIKVNAFPAKPEVAMRIVKEYMAGTR